MAASLDLNLYRERAVTMESGFRSAEQNYIHIKCIQPKTTVDNYVPSDCQKQPSKTTFLVILRAQRRYGLNVLTNSILMS